MVSKMMCFRDLCATEGLPEALDQLKFPRYIIIGDQSSGKTSMLSRLARMPLGFTGNRTGTQRPFEFVLHFDKSRLVPAIKVEGKEVSEAALFATLKRENEQTHGSMFSSIVVHVEIYSSKVPNIILVDMPGLKDLSQGNREDGLPEDMLKHMLRDPSAVPVVLLEPRDSQQTHRVFQVLADLGRANDSAVVVVNKVDEKIMPGCQWDAPDCWIDYWRALQDKQFKAAFFAGWPIGCSCSFRQDPLAYMAAAVGGGSEPDRDNNHSGSQCQRLLDSFAAEEHAFRNWSRRMKRQHVAVPGDCLGLTSFAAFLAKDLAQHAQEFSSTCASLLPELQAMVTQKLFTAQVDHSVNVLGNKLVNFVLRVTDILSQQTMQVMNGKLGELPDASSMEASRFYTMEQDLAYLCDCSSGSEPLLVQWAQQLELPPKYRAALTKLADDWNDNIDQVREFTATSVDNFHMPLCGGAQLKRDESLFIVWAYMMLLKNAHIVDAESFQNRLGKGNCWDSGNSVLRQEVMVVLSRSLHPLTDLFTVFLRKHFLDGLARAEQMMKKDSDDFTEIIKEAPSLDWARFFGDFKEAYNKVVDERLKCLNRHLHESLDAQAGSLCHVRLGLISSSLAQELIDNKTGFTPKGNMWFSHACTLIDGGLQLFTDDVLSSTRLLKGEGAVLFSLAMKLLDSTRHPVMQKLNNRVHATMTTTNRRTGLTSTEVVDLKDSFSLQVKNVKDFPDTCADASRLMGGELTSSARQTFDMRVLLFQFNCILLAHHGDMVEKAGCQWQHSRYTLGNELSHKMTEHFNQPDKQGSQVRAYSYGALHAAELEATKRKAEKMQQLLAEIVTLADHLAESSQG